MSKMAEFEEKREYLRTESNCRMTYQLANSHPVNEGLCLNLSGSGILFRAEKEIDTGKALEVCVYPDNSVATPFTAYVEVLRSDPVEDGFAIAASIKAIKAA